MKNWRNAATVIIAASKTPAITNAPVYSGCDSEHKEKTDFQILALKKSSESPLLAGHYVFPGGTFNIADSSDEWIQLFKKFGHSVDTLCNSLNNYNTKLPIFESDRNSLPNSISLRITAIRETFEECGILLCKRATNKPNSFKSLTSEHLNIEDIAEWRKRVLKNPKEFLNLCLMNDCCPDVSSIYLWSNWLSPSSLPTRFDSVFFMAFLEDIIEATPDNYEIKSLKWVHAKDLIHDYYDGVAKIVHPQLYEISRLSNFTSFSKLTEFAYHLNGLQSEQWMPVFMFFKNGMLVILPGDELYPNPPDYFNQNVIIKDDEPMESFFCQKMNRLLVPNEGRSKIFANSLSTTFEHVLPWCPHMLNSLQGKL